MKYPVLSATLFFSALLATESLVTADTFPNFTSFDFATYDASFSLENVSLDSGTLDFPNSTAPNWIECNRLPCLGNCNSRVFLRPRLNIIPQHIIRFKYLCVHSQLKPSRRHDHTPEELWGLFRIQHKCWGRIDRLTHYLENELGVVLGFEYQCSKHTTIFLNEYDGGLSWNYDLADGYCYITPLPVRNAFGNEDAFVIPSFNLNYNISIGDDITMDSAVNFLPAQDQKKVVELPDSNYEIFRILEHSLQTRFSQMTFATPFTAGSPSSTPTITASETTAPSTH
ncbi:uncharacterized protein PAC_08773 [Phialocephala subalpina]|uniref:Uncharacterized protein n=1 Tax=Phialocephala subalpina TaxID=576137 RepID=A0A1L7X1H9_9HELO|nr:uncharacterized protein PAC_08773 [Phialocephala subalpina]